MFIQDASSKNTQTVTSVDFVAKEVRIDSGKETIPYDNLILATGGTPRRLPIEGATLENVYTFRNLNDAKKVNDGRLYFISFPMQNTDGCSYVAAISGKRMVVIGSSFISMEVVSSVASRNLASIDVIGLGEYPLQTVLGKEVGKGFKEVCRCRTLVLSSTTHDAILQQSYEATFKVNFHMQSKIEKIVASETDPTLATGVVVNGQTLPADFVVMGVGVAPATQFLKDSGIKLERDGGVKVDAYLRVEGLDNVYAIGGCCVVKIFREEFNSIITCRRYCPLPGSKHRLPYQGRTLECQFSSFALWCPSKSDILRVLDCRKSWESGWRNNCRLAY
jgi:apoptosis-inducing factor 3